MAKKFIHIGLSLLLMVATTGFNLSMHYCGGELVSTSVNKEAKSCCDMDGCCNNETLHFEVEDDFVGSAPAALVNTVELQILFPVYFIANQDLISKESKSVHAFYDSSHPPGTQARLARLQRYLC